ncbi:DoxX family protein [Nocardia callitridis]|uniref:DoxX family protein n=1 Tax=Nocardia callitridis TaxID=648753 RepID=A0ABP9KDH4_9NOCA
MGAVSTDVPESEVADQPRPARPRWNPLTKFAFRFGCLYFALIFVLFGQIPLVFLGVINRELPLNAGMWAMRALNPVSEWVGREVFGVDAVLNEQSGSGDQTAIWVLVFVAVIVSLVGAALWSALDRRRAEYTVLFPWFLLVVRLGLAGQMIHYGIAKVIPSQMPEPALTTLLAPFGSMAPAGVLWSQVGSSPVYEILLGAAEVLGGLLLFLPRTATLGSMLSLVAMLQVFVLNMTFDVPVKIHSFHLVLLSLVLLAPQAKRLADVLVLERHSEPATQQPLFGSRRANRIAASVQVALGIWVVASAAWLDGQAWDEWGGGMPEPPLYGIWAVRDYTVDGVQVAPLTTDENRWQRVIFDKSGTTIQHMNGSFEPAVAAVDSEAKTLTLSSQPTTPDAAPIRLGEFRFTQPRPDQLTLDGDLDGAQAVVTLEHVDVRTFPLKGPAFHWVQDVPNFGG